jgi:hypothetical protein
MNTDKLIAEFLERGGQITKGETVVAAGAYGPGEAKPDCEQASMRGNLNAVAADQRPKKRGNPNWKPGKGRPSGQSPTEVKFTPYKAAIMADYHQWQNFSSVARKWGASDGSMTTLVKKWLAERGTPYEKK